jgi:hypothetical protein
MATRPQRRLPNLTKFLTLAIRLNAHIHGFFHAIGLPFAIRAPLKTDAWTENCSLFKSPIGFELRFMEF